MTICPIAVAVGCKKCAVYSVCPLKSVIGDVRPPEVVQMTPRTEERETTSETDQG